MSNAITLEFCAEDRARIDNLTAALIANGGAAEALFKQLQTPIVAPSCMDDIAKMAAAAVSPENASQLAEETTQAETPETEDFPSPTGELPPWEATAPAAKEEAEPAKEEAEPAKEEAEPAKEEAPTVTLAQIQQKVIQLAAGFGGAKKAKVREIVNAYAKKVSDLPEDKWAEVWDKLTVLESEG